MFIRENRERGGTENQKDRDSWTRGGGMAAEGKSAEGQEKDRQWVTVTITLITEGKGDS